MSEASVQPAGQIIEGRYRIVRRIAEGGMATVYEAVDQRLSRPVAIKVMHTQLAQGPHRAQFQERFRREARSAAAIANPHIVQVYDTGEFQGLDYLVMEYVHGINLRREMNAEGTFTVRETLRIVGEILDGLAAAHRAGVVHRDIKPENILINDRGHVQITDFGLAKAASQATLSTTGMLLGTAAYLAPEMIERNQATMQGDLYAVGIIAWEMIVGQVPFLSDNPVTVVFKHVHEDVPPLRDAAPGVPAQVDAFVAKLTARAVDARPADAIQAAAELSALMATLSADQLRWRRAENDAAGSDAGAGPDANANAGGATSRLAGTAAPIPAPPTGQPGTHDATAPSVSSASSVSSSSPVQTPLTTPLPTALPTTPLPSTPLPVNPVLADAQAAQSGQSTQPGQSDPSETQPIVGAPARPQSFGQLFDGLDAVPATGGKPANAAAKPPRSRKGIVIGSVCGLLLAAAAAGGGWAWWYYLGPGSYWQLPAASDVSCAQGEVCAIAGADAASYLAQLDASGIPYERTDDYSDDVDSGRIIAIDPQTAGSRVSKRSGQTVTVSVSKGARQATVPADIADASSASGKDPITALTNAGFDAVTHSDSSDEYSLDVPQGALISINLTPGKTYRHDESVTVVLSKGPKPVTMPSIVGATRDEATAALGELKLNANVTEAFDDKVEAGKVVSASAAAGAQLKWGDTVDVVVSKGPQMAVVPNVVGQQYADAEKTLKDLGFDVKQSAPLGDWTHTVRVQSIAAGDTVRVRDENGTPTVITLTVA